MDTITYHLFSKDIVRSVLNQIIVSKRIIADFERCVAVCPQPSEAFNVNDNQRYQWTQRLATLRGDLKSRIVHHEHMITPYADRSREWRFDGYVYDREQFERRRAATAAHGECMAHAINEEDGAYFVDHVWDRLRGNNKLRRKLREVFEEKTSVTLYQCDSCNALQADDDDWGYVNDEDHWCPSCIEDNARYSHRMSTYISDGDAIPYFDSYSSWQNDDPDDWITWRYLTRSSDIYSAERSDGNGNCGVDEDTYSMINEEERRDEDEPDVNSYHSGVRVGHIPSEFDKRKYPVLLGIELEFEFDDNCDMHESVDWLKSSAMHRRYFELERDGSLNRGFEAITGHTGLDVHRKKIMSMLDHDGTLYCRALADGPKNGLHIHVSKLDMTAWHQTKLAAFIYDPDNREFMNRLARRRIGGEYNTEVDYLEYAKRVGQRHLYMKQRGVQDWSARDYANNGFEDWSRYGALSVCTSTHRTVEFRMFKGSTDAEEILAWAEFCYAAWFFSQQYGMKDMTVEAFIKYVYRVDCRSDTPYLRKYLEGQMVHQSALDEASRLGLGKDNQQKRILLKGNKPCPPCLTSPEIATVAGS